MAKAKMTYKKAKHIIDICNKFMTEEEKIRGKVTTAEQGEVFVAEWTKKTEPTVREAYPEFDYLPFKEMRSRAVRCVWNSVNRKHGVTN